MTEIVFPDGFLWGAATSAHQVEGHNVDNDWWAWEQAGRVQTSSGAACEHYHRFRDDFDLAVSLGHTAHRFSIEWSRIEPREGERNDEALAHYQDVVRALRERRLEPIVTLHHFTTPTWMAQQGGWTNPKVVERFARYTEWVAKALGTEVRYWLTVNEPMVFVNMHYVQGVGPPGVVEFRSMLRVIEHLIRAHAASYQVLHRAGPPGQIQVSVAKNMPVFLPCRRWWPLDHLANWTTDRIFNTAFLTALTEGRWVVPGIGAWRIPEARGTLDYLGINYYGRQFIRCRPETGQWFGASCGLEHHYPHDVNELTGMGWDVSPEGLTTTLLRGAKLGVPILVTENGVWVEDDVRRWGFIARHLAALERARQRGARIIGYLYWSLMDNYEWSHGFGPRFGLVEVDYATQARRPRESAHRFADVCRTNRLDARAIPE